MKTVPFQDVTEYYNNVPNPYGQRPERRNYTNLQNSFKQYSNPVEIQGNQIILSKAY